MDLQSLSSQKSALALSQPTGRRRRIVAPVGEMCLEILGEIEIKIVYICLSVLFCILNYIQWPCMLSDCNFMLSCHISQEKRRAINQRLGLQATKPCFDLPCSISNSRPVRIPMNPRDYDLWLSSQSERWQPENVIASLSNAEHLRLAYGFAGKIIEMAWKCVNCYFRWLFVHLYGILYAADPPSNFLYKTREFVRCIQHSCFNCLDVIEKITCSVCVCACVLIGSSVFIGNNRVLKSYMRSWWLAWQEFESVI